MGTEARAQQCVGPFSVTRSCHAAQVGLEPPLSFLSARVKVCTIASFFLLSQAGSSSSAYGAQQTVNSWVPASASCFSGAGT